MRPGGQDEPATVICGICGFVMNEVGECASPLVAVVWKLEERTAGMLMGLAAGVMITLSFAELVNQAWESSGYLVTTLGFAAGALAMFLADSLTPHIRFAEEERRATNVHMLKTGLLMAIGIILGAVSVFLLSGMLAV
jgi:zinc transporter ZupT